MNRRRMMSGRKFLVTYSLGTLPAHNYIRLNGEGEILTGRGEIEVRSGDFLLCYAYSNEGSFIEKDGVTVAESKKSSVTFKFYPKADAKIEIESGDDIIGLYFVITTV